MVSEQKDTEFQHDEYGEYEEKLEKEFGMRITETVKEGANSMCNISDLIEERGIKKEQIN